MKLVSRFEAAIASITDLRGMLKKAFAVCAAAPPCSQERCDALASIRTIEIELARRPPCL